MSASMMQAKDLDVAAIITTFNMLLSRTAVFLGGLSDRFDRGLDASDPPATNTPPIYQHELEIISSVSQLLSHSVPRYRARWATSLRRSRLDASAPYPINTTNPLVYVLSRTTRCV